MRFSNKFSLFSLIILMLMSSVASTIVTSTSASSDKNSMLSPETTNPTQSTYEGVTPGDLTLPSLQDFFEYQMDIVFLGFNESRINESLLIEEIPSWYAPIDRYDRLYNEQDIFDVNYTLSYNFKYIDNSTVAEVRDDLFAMAEFNDEPVFSQDDNDTYYIPSDLTEKYLHNKFTVNDRPTMFLLDLYSWDPINHHEHLYNSSEIDIDGDSIARPYGSEYQIAGGGNENRLLWLDLSVGGSDYRDDPSYYYPYAGINDTLIPNVWDDRYSDNTYNLTIDISKYISTAIELRYLPSYLYTPGTAFEKVRFEYILMDLDDTGFDFLSELDADYITNGYSALNPNIEWTHSITDYNWQEDSSFSDMIIEAKNAVELEYNSSLIIQWINSNFERLTNQSNDDVLSLPIFLFGLPGRYTFDYFLGIANNLGGEFAYVISVTNVFWSTPGYKMYNDDVFSSTSFTAPSTSYTYVAFSGGSYDEIFETDISSSNSVNLYVMDQENYDDWENSRFDELDVLLNVSDFTGTDSFNVSTDIIDTYYWVVRSNTGSTFDITIDIDQYRDRSFGFSFVSMHEIGHALGLSHPHDGYTWEGNNVYQENTDYLYWLWDHSYTQMTYAGHVNNVSIMDIDTSMRGTIPIYYEKLSNRLDDIMLGLTQEDHVYIPEPLYLVLVDIISNMDEINDIFNNYDSSTNLNQSLSLIFEAHTSIKELEQTLETEDYTIDLTFMVTADADINLTQVEYKVELLQSNKIRVGNLTEDGSFTLENMPWVEYLITFMYKGEEVGQVTDKTWDPTTNVELSIPASLIPTTPESSEDTGGGFLSYNILVGLLSLIVIIPITYRRK